jgi:hypothetical protein
VDVCHPNVEEFAQVQAESGGTVGAPVDEGFRSVGRDLIGEDLFLMRTWLTEPDAKLEENINNYYARDFAKGPVDSRGIHLRNFLDAKLGKCAVEMVLRDRHR